MGLAPWIPYMEYQVWGQESTSMKSSRFSSLSFLLYFPDRMAWAVRLADFWAALSIVTEPVITKFPFEKKPSGPSQREILTKRGSHATLVTSINFGMASAKAVHNFYWVIRAIYLIVPNRTVLLLKCIYFLLDLPIGSLSRYLGIIFKAWVSHYS